MEVIHSGIVLYDRRKQQPESKAQVGDVARLSDRRIVARSRFDFPDGTAAWGVRDYVPGETPNSSPAIVAPKNWGRWIDNELEQFAGRYFQLCARDFLPEAQLEFERFRREWKHVAAAIGLDAPPARTELFDVGRVFYTWRHSDTGLAGYQIAWRGFLEQHQAGSFGTYGHHNDVPLITDDELWTLAEQPVLVANKAAISAKAGAVLSRYVLPDALQREARASGKVAVLDVITVLAPRGVRTLMTCQCVKAAS